MTDQDWRRVSQVLAGTLIVLVAAVAAVLILRALTASVGPGPSASPSANPSASVLATASASPVLSPDLSPSPLMSPSPSPLPSPSPEPSPSPSPTPETTPSPTPEVTPSPSLAPSPSPTPQPTATPTLAPTAPIADIRFRNVGFDGPLASTPTQRELTFTSEGPGTVTATLGQTSAGDVTICLFPADRDPRASECVTAGQATLTKTTSSAGHQVWKVTAIGAGDSASPSADLRLEFRSSSPSVTLDGFRFQGTSAAGYNGVQARFKLAGAGAVTAKGSWVGADRPWMTSLVALSSGETVASDSGVGNDLSLSAPNAQPGSYRLTLSNTEDVADQEVFLHAVIGW